jgi:hypothetical protein
VAKKPDGVLATEVLVNLLHQHEGFGSGAGDTPNQRLDIRRKKCSRHSLTGHVSEGNLLLRF